MKPAAVTDNIDTSSRDYWADKVSALDKEDLIKTEQFEKLMLKEYKAYQKEVKGIIKDFYKTFADANNITMAEAKKILNGSDLSNYLENMEYHIKQMEDQGIDPAIIKKYQSMTERLRIKRLEAILTEINAQTDILTGKLEQLTEKYLTGSIQSSFWQQAHMIADGLGVNIKYEGLDPLYIEKLIKMKWIADKNWQVSFQDEDKNLKKYLFDIVNQGAILGWTEQEMIEELLKKVALSYARAQVNVRTNKNFLENQARKEAYIQSGFDKYTFIAMEPRGQHPHRLCTLLNGSDHDLKDAVVGVNYPPISYNCRSTTAPKITDTGLEQMKEKVNGRLEENLSYEEYMKKYYPAQYIELLKGGLL